MYDSIDSAHDGTIDVFFDGAPGHPGAITAIAFVGKPETAPSELPVLTGRTREELARDYGEPIGSSPIRQGWQYPYFRNGVVAQMRGGKTYEYGVSRRAK